MDITGIIANKLSLPKDKVSAAVALLDEGCTVPFVARYRKEVTGSMSDTVLRDLSDLLTSLRNLEKRKEEVRALIDGQGLLTPEIEASLEKAATVTEVEDIYRPYRPKRKTRASVAREKGLEPLAELLRAQKTSYGASIEKLAEAYLSDEEGKEVPTVGEALAGACDIIAEDLSDEAQIRQKVRRLTGNAGTIRSEKVGEDEKGTYSMYYEFDEKLTKLPPHRVLALNRAENEEVLKVSLEVPEDLILNDLFSQVIENPNSPAVPYLSRAVVDGYERLLAPSVEREIRSSMFDDACESAIRLFAVNLKNLLMQPPVKGKTVLGLDPGYRTGCKLAVVDKTGKVLDTAVIYPTKPQERIEESARIVKRLIDKYGVDLVTVGNGTASKESEIFIANTIRPYGGKVRYVMVNEAGASVYSASKLGAEEFPDFDVTQRSAVSLARRIQDPLAELVKIDPKSIGVGQYQHDMKPARLSEALGGVVEDCVNSVGVDLNTASAPLLSYVAGINSTSAKNIVKYREENGEFTSRAQLLKVPRIGAKAYEQCAGFLRVPGSKEILDNTAVHPESYEAAKGLLSLFGFTEEDVRSGKLSTLREMVKKYGSSKTAQALGIGEPTMNDIIGELEKPGRDPRDSLPQPELREDVMDISDLKEGMVMSGVVRNVTDFGAFVDIGVHQDGLVHISRICDRFIKHPSEALSIGDHVSVKVLEVDLKKKRISLTMKF